MPGKGSPGPPGQEVLLPLSLTLDCCNPSWHPQLEMETFANNYRSLLHCKGRNARSSI